MTINVPYQPLRYPSILLEAKVAITICAKRLCIGSTMEIGAMDGRILFPRVQVILEAVPRFYLGYADGQAFRKLAEFEKLKECMGKKSGFTTCHFLPSNCLILFLQKNGEFDDCHRSCHAWT